MDLAMAALSLNAGPVTQIFLGMIQEMLVTQQSISPASMWPKNYGPYAKSNYDHILGEFIA